MRGTRIHGVVRLVLLAALWHCATEAQAVVRVCHAIEGLASTSVDAGEALQGCIHRASPGDVVELPPGQYTIGRQIRITKPLTLRTAGTSESSPRCPLWHAPQCAELIPDDRFLRLPETPLRKSASVVYVDANNVSLSNLVLSGGRGLQRHVNYVADLGAGGSANRAASIIILYGDDLRITNSVIKGALGIAGLQLLNHPGTRSSGFRLERSTIAYNGFRAPGASAFADGALILDAYGAILTDLDFFNNTDIDLVFGGCERCRIENVRITHDASPYFAADAALLVHYWPEASAGRVIVPHSGGNYTGTIFRDIAVDCGPSQRCGTGIGIGAGSYYHSAGNYTVHGVLANASIRNARVNLVIQKTGPFRIENLSMTNPWTSSGGYGFVGYSSFVPAAYFPADQASLCHALSAQLSSLIMIDSSSIPLIDFPQFQAHEAAGNVRIADLSGCLPQPVSSAELPPIALPIAQAPLPPVANPVGDVSMAGGEGPVRAALAQMWIDLTGAPVPDPIHIDYDYQVGIVGRGESLAQVRDRRVVELEGLIKPRLRGVWIELTGSPPPPLPGSGDLDAHVRWDLWRMRFERLSLAQVRRLRVDELRGLIEPQLDWIWIDYTGSPAPEAQASFDLGRLRDGWTLAQIREARRVDLSPSRGVSAGLAAGASRVTPRLESASCAAVHFSEAETPGAAASYLMAWLVLLPLFMRIALRRLTGRFRFIVSYRNAKTLISRRRWPAHTDSP